MKKLQIPYGTQDYYVEECYQKLETERLLSDYFFKSGFERVQPSTLEYYGLFSELLSLEAVNKMFKMTDNDGSLLVLRPDTTVQICRMAICGNLLENNIAKLYYVENSFEYLPKSSTSRSREFAQIGVEMLGKSGFDGDAEILITAIEALKRTGLNDFLIDTGHAGFFNALCQEANFAATEKQQIKEYINNKDEFSLKAFLSGKKINADLCNAFIEMPKLFGGEAVLKKAKSLTKNKDALKAVENLKYVYSAALAAGVEKNISFDLGMLHGTYYDGIIFKGMISSIGVPILDGGRYDGLFGSLGQKTEAVGFAIGVKRLLTALKNEGKTNHIPPPDIAYISFCAPSETEFKLKNQWQTENKRAIKLYCSENELLSYVKEKQIKKAVIINGSDAKEILL